MITAGTMWDLIVARAQVTPEETMAVDERGSRLTFAELRDRAERTAAGLAAKPGFGPGDVVSWQLPSWIESIVLVGALARLGVVQNPILPIYREREVGFITAQAGSKILIVPGGFRGFDFEAMARGCVGSSTAVVVAARTLPEADPATLGPPPTSGDDVRWLFYTSGTTSEPKGARHTDTTVAAAALGMNERLALTPKDRHSLVFPFTHIGGIIWMFSGLQVGLLNIIDEAFNPETTIPLLRAHDVTLAGAGTYFHMAYLAAQRAHPREPLFPRVRACPGGGAPKPPQLHFDIKRELGGAGIVSGYGLTEAPILTMASPEDPDDALANCEGTAMAGVDLKLVTLDGKPAGIGEEGEVRAKAPQLMKGYLDAALDADAFDADGYFRTGDLGRLDAAGNLTITGRLKDIIIRKGENISAKEVEDLLFTHDAVADVAVIGLPDAASGERACAVIVPSGGAPTLQDLTAFLTENGLRAQALPEQLEVVDELPRNPAGKVLKQDLRARLS
jgi:acyl-CoA synthetase (AMP-forming)/AMP-acid ligase II